MKPLGIEPAMFVGVGLDDQRRPVSLDAPSDSLKHQELGPFDVDLDEQTKRATHVSWVPGSGWPLGAQEVGGLWGQRVGGPIRVAVTRS